MEFKKSSADFSTRNPFGSDLKRFISDEAARFTPEGNEAASASIDSFAEKSLRFSAEKNKRTAKEKKAILSQIKDNQKNEFGKDDPIYQSVLDDGVSSSYSKEKDSSSGSTSDSDSKFDSRDSDRFDSGSSADSHEHQEKQSKEQTKEQTKNQENVKKEKNKETKKAGIKTAVASELKGKKDLSNDLVGDRSTGDAMKDGMSGLMKTFAEAVNPMRWVKSLLFKLAAFLAPYIAMFMMIVAIIMIIIMFIFSVLEPIAKVGEAISSFLSFFTGGDDNSVSGAYLTDEEIEDIVAGITCDETQETVIRFALDKVGYPYSQAERESGDAYDCSSLAYYAWKEADVDIGYGCGYPPMASVEAKNLESDGKSLEEMDLLPGDLVFYGGSSNGRYMGIYHVAIYIGEGMAVEAYNEDNGVVYQKLRTENAIMVCRPN